MSESSFLFFKCVIKMDCFFLFSVSIERLKLVAVVDYCAISWYKYMVGIILTVPFPIDITIWHVKFYYPPKFFEPLCKLICMMVVFIWVVGVWRPCEFLLNFIAVNLFRNIQCKIYIKNWFIKIHNYYFYFIY